MENHNHSKAHVFVENTSWLLKLSKECRWNYFDFFLTFKFTDMFERIKWPFCSQQQLKVSGCVLIRGGGGDREEEREKGREWERERDRVLLSQVFPLHLQLWPDFSMELPTLRSCGISISGLWEPWEKRWILSSISRVRKVYAILGTSLFKTHRCFFCLLDRIL